MNHCCLPWWSRGFFVKFPILCVVNVSALSLFKYLFCRCFQDIRKRFCELWSQIKKYWMRLLSTHHVLSRVHNAVYHEISRQKSFVVFYMSAKLLYENLRWRYSDMDLRESMWDSTKVFLRMSMCTTCRKIFLPQNFHDIR